MSLDHPNSIGVFVFLALGVLMANAATAEPLPPLLVDPLMIRTGTVKKPPLEKVDAAGMAAPVSAPPVTPSTLDAPPDVKIAHGYFLQFGAFADRRNADALLNKLKGELGSMADTLCIKHNGKLSLVQIGPWPAAADARRAAQRVGRERGIAAIIVQG